jgi:large subunit ribosomal protein L15
MLQPHTISSSKGSRHAPKRVGRGNASGHGTSATRGGKGQTARSGGSRGLNRLGFKHILQATPKLRGFKSIHTKPQEVSLDKLEKHYNAGETVSLETLKEKGLVHEAARAAKILNTGALTKKLTISGVLYTKGAGDKLKAVGGEVK